MDAESIQKAVDMISAIVMVPEAGKVYSGKVTRLMNFGAFVEIAPGKEGLVHISKLARRRVANVEDAVKVGDEVNVKLLEIDAQGRLNLSIRDTLPPEPGEEEDSYNKEGGQRRERRLGSQQGRKKFFNRDRENKPSESEE